MTAYDLEGNEHPRVLWARERDERDRIWRDPRFPELSSQEQARMLARDDEGPPFPWGIVAVGLGLWAMWHGWSSPRGQQSPWIGSGAVLVVVGAGVVWYSRSG